MMSTQQIERMADDAAMEAAAKGRRPYVPFDGAEVKRGRWAAKVPNLGSYRPEGFTMVDAWLVDATGMGLPSEPALTFGQLVVRAVPLAESPLNYGFAVIEQGQFQIVLGIFVPDEDLPAWLGSDDKPFFSGVGRDFADETREAAERKASAMADAAAHAMAQHDAAAHAMAQHDAAGRGHRGPMD